MKLEGFGRGRFAGIAVFLFLASVSPSSAQAPAPAGPPLVQTTVVKLAAVTRESEFVGTVAPIQSVDIRARVEGFLDSVNFKEGGFVQSGALLFEIEKDTYQAALDGANATLAAATATEAGAQANLKQAEMTLTRQIELLKTNAVSQSSVDQATATRDASAAQVQQAQAQIAQAQAQIATAKLNLSYTDVSTPITGRIGKTQVTVGNLVSPSGGPLATVIQMDPIRVVFSLSDREYLRVVEQLKPTEQGFAADAATFQPQLKLSDGTVYASPGKITFLDNTIDATTGTIAVFAEFANPALQLIPGQYVSVTVQEGQAQQLPVVAASAVQLDQNGNYVFVLGEGNVATIRRVTLGVRVGTDWSVASGLTAGDAVIVSGIQKIKAGITVKPEPAAGN